MKKLLLILLISLTWSISAQFENLPIENVSITLADDSQQDVGSPYKIILSFDVIGQPHGTVWCAFIRKSDHATTNVFWAGPLNNGNGWPIFGGAVISNPNTPGSFNFQITTIPNGHRLISEPIQIGDIYSAYPNGDYELTIDQFIGSSNGFFVSGRTSASYLLANTLTFNINDICPTCPSLFEGHDDDGDGLLSIDDNCPETYNPNQIDIDGDGIGDVCDNCPNIHNSNQADNDDDGIGNYCDDEDNGDFDNDGVENFEDNCHDVFNPSQIDSDSDGIGDVCDDESNINLRLKKFEIAVSSQGYYDVYPGGQISTFRYGSSHQFKIEIENNDIGDSGSFSCQLLVSGFPNAIQNNRPIFGLGTIYFDEISGNSSLNRTFTTTIYDGIGGLNFIEMQPYYIYIIIDNFDDVVENIDGENDNIRFATFNYINPNNSRVIYLDIGNELVGVPLNNDIIAISPSNIKEFNKGALVVNKPIRSFFNLKIYSLDNLGYPVVDQNVVNNQTLNLADIPSGIYAVHVNNQYVKKFIKTSKFIKK